MPALLGERLDAIEAMEVHWSAGTILAVFFAASLISAVFFGMGYSFGHGGTSKPILGATSFNAGSIKGTTAGQSVPVPAKSAPWQSRSAALSRNAAAPVNDGPHPAMKLQAKIVPPLVAVPVRQKPAVHASSAPISVTKKSIQPIAAPARAPAIAGVGHYMVQVGAIGDHKDARRLVAGLKGKGFKAGIYPGKHDRFLHVQIGPFLNFQQAQTVRHRVLASGYPAILKHAS